MNSKVQNLADQLCAELSKLDIDEQVECLNSVRQKLHEAGPFKDEPVDLVVWEKASNVKGNDYNPNSVAPPEMKLLERSILEDGFTQPVVSFKEDESKTIIDGFHRSAVGSSNTKISKRLYGYLPLTLIRKSQEGVSDRMASTIRHNRARGTHSVDLMRDIVGELVESGMSDAWIMKHIGMDADELLRLKQISGIAALFQDRAFSQAWAKDARDAEWYDDQEAAHV